MGQCEGAGMAEGRRLGRECRGGMGLKECWLIELIGLQDICGMVIRGGDVGSKSAKEAAGCRGRGRSAAHFEGHRCPS